MLKVIFIGDVVGKLGRAAVKGFLPSIKAEFAPDIVIANGENAAGGFGIDLKCCDELFKAGVDYLTTGNHVWKKKELITYLSAENPKVIRPANYQGNAPGKGFIRIKLDSGKSLLLANVMGRVFLPELLNCPFQAAEDILSEVSENNLDEGHLDYAIFDFHAEATSEKVAFGHFLDGRVSAVLGTHTHIQTSDEGVLEAGTAYITDVGMCGPDNSVIGMNKRHVIDKFRTSRPGKFELAGGAYRFNAVYLELPPLPIDHSKVRIQRIFLRS